MTAIEAYPPIIQGGMGVAVSNWVLARATALRGQLGVVSGTGLDTVLARRLQDGDASGDMRRAMRAFPIPEVAPEVERTYFRAGGRAPGEPYRLLPLHRIVPQRAREMLTILANFVEVHLAKEGHEGPVGVNLLTKVQLPTLASLYGAMLAGVDYVLMGAGIPREIPGALDRLAGHEPASLTLDIEDQNGDGPRTARLEPTMFWPAATPPLRRPRFLPIVGSSLLARMLAKKANGRVDGFVVEGPTAGGHNAPPRGQVRYGPRGEPLYGERDVVDLEDLRALGLPFWVAGGVGSPEALARAREAGAVGIQVGTLFAFCDESGLDAAYRRGVLEAVSRGDVEVRTDPRASPTGYPFKVVQWDGGSGAVRERICDMGYLRTPYVRPDGGIGFRCASEPVETYVAKGGERDDTVGRQCLCNALLANVGLGQVRAGGRREPPLLTAGDDLPAIARFLKGRTQYTAGEVIDYLLGEAAA